MDKPRWGNEPFCQPRKEPHELRDLRTVAGVGLRARVPSGAQTLKQASKQDRESMLRYDLIGILRFKVLY